MIEKLIIGAPFGNMLTWSHCTSTLGTFTLQYRGSLAYRLWRCALTLRPHLRMKAWTNRLGLPNPGIKWLLDRRYIACKKIVSVSACCTADWETIFSKLWYSTNEIEALELNVSCPNYGDNDESNYAKVFRLARARFTFPVIVKLPPVNYDALALLAAQHGLGVHCCNTLPTPAGGLSGKPLQLLSLAAVDHCRNVLQIPLVIGGGGITHMEDVRRFSDAGATHFAIASALLNPFNWLRIKRIAKELADE